MTLLLCCIPTALVRAWSMVLSGKLQCKVNSLMTGVQFDYSIGQKLQSVFRGLPSSRPPVHLQNGRTREGGNAEWEEQQEFWPLIQNLHATPALSSEKPGTTMLPLYAQQSVHKLTEKFTGA